VKLRKATISFVISVHPQGTTRLPLEGFREILYWEDWLNLDNTLHEHLRTFETNFNPLKSEIHTQFKRISKPLYIIYNLHDTQKLVTTSRSVNGVCVIQVIQFTALRKIR
jgi:hypothetical protein